MKSPKAQIYDIIRLLIKAGEWSSAQYAIEELKEALKELVFLNYLMEEELKKNNEQC